MSRLTRPWSEAEDRRLIAWGGCIEDGYAFIALNDLGRTEDEGRDRIAWLRSHRPGFVERVALETLTAVTKRRRFRKCA